MRISRALALAAACAVGLGVMGGPGGIARGDEVVEGKRAVVIAGHPLATKAGLDVLRSGGTAADALVATSLTVGVTEPMNSGIGGKLILLYYNAKTQEVSCIGAMGQGPLGLTKEMIAEHKVGSKSRGWMVPCTPGLPAGLAEAHKRWGKKPWAEVVMPAAKIADEGFVLSKRGEEMFAEFPLTADKESARIYAPTGKHPRAGDRMKNPDLAKSLRMLANDGVGALYGGPIGKRVAEAAKANGGFLTERDFAEYKPRVLKPLVAGYRGHVIYSSPPPLTGGSTVLMALRTLQETSWDGMKPRGAQYIDTMARALAQVHPVVSATAGDVEGSYEKVMEALKEGSVEKLRERAKERPSTTGSSGDATGMLNAPIVPEDGPVAASTTHLLVIDEEGNVACCTQSLGIHFGSAVVAPGTGFLLNSDMGNFALTGSGLNSYAPGKWPRSTMAPTIVVKDAKPVMVLGSPASARIPSVVLQALVDVIDFKVPLATAVRSPRFHMRRVTSGEGRGNWIDIEDEAPATLDAELEALGWKVRRRKLTEFYFGSVNSAVIGKDGTITGVADQRRTSDAAGK